MLIKIYIYMLKILQENHLAIFDARKQFLSSFTFTILPQPTKKQEQPNENEIVSPDSQFTFQLHIENQFTHQWQSDYYELLRQDSDPYFGSMPFSLETYHQMYQNPLKHKFTLKAKPQTMNISKQLINKPIGKLIIKTKFLKNPSVLPLWMLTEGLQSKKKINIIIEEKDNQRAVCYGEPKQIIQAEEVPQFIHDSLRPRPNKFLIYQFQVSERVRQDNIVILVGKFVEKLLTYDKITIRILSARQNIQFMHNLNEIFRRIKGFMELENITIVQNVYTDIEDGHNIAFFTDLSSLYTRIFRSFLHSKIKDKWIIEGMVHYNHNHKHFEECMTELAQLISDGQQFFPLKDNQFYFDQVWRAKAKSIYHILANLKSTADSVGRSLASFIIEYSKKRKVCTTYLFKKLKNSYGLEGIRKTYYEQFITSTGMNKIFYEAHYNKDNTVKIIVRQKALASKIFKLYNLFRIKLQQTFGVVSPLTEKIIKKNKYNQAVKKKQLSGPLSIPKYIQCIPYFVAKIKIELDGGQPFSFDLLQQNLMQKSIQFISQKPKRMIQKKANEVDQINQFVWMMIDTAETFPAIYKHENVTDRVIQYLLKREFDREIQELKIMNDITQKQHGQNQSLCRVILEKAKIKTGKQNTSISIKRKALSLLPNFMSKVKDGQIWDDVLALVKLYEPICYDFSEQGSMYLHSLLEAIGNIEYRKQFAYYFQQFHRIMIAILKYHSFSNQHKQQMILKQIFYSLMNWKSIYSLEILQCVKNVLETYESNFLRYKSIIRVILKNVLPYMNGLKLRGESVQLANKIKKLLNFFISKDQFGELYATKFEIELQQKQQQLNSIGFLTYAFDKLNYISETFPAGYYLCLKAFKNIIISNRKKYGFQIQLETLNENQSYFLAQYLWKMLTDKMVISNAKVRLQWMKIYRIFYFYFTPVITMVKIKKSVENHNLLKEFNLQEQQFHEISNNIMDFIPDINWFSVYDSSSKVHKKKVQSLQDVKKRKKHQQLVFGDQNYITRFIKENPGKDSWQQLSKHALKWVIQFYDDKEIDNPNEKKYKDIIQGLKGVNNYLKRGNMPQNYSLQRLKRDTFRVLNDHDEENPQVVDIFKMLDNTLREIQQQKKEKDYQANLSGGTRIAIPKAIIQKESEQKQQIKFQTL